MEGWLLRLLLRLHPAEFRARYGAQMVEVYLRRASASDGSPSRRIAMLLDIAGGVVATRVSRFRSRIGRRGLLGLPAAGGGTLAAGVCGAAICCPAHAALLGPIGLASASLGFAVEPVQGVLLVLATGLLIVPGRGSRHRVAMLAALALTAFLASLPLMAAALHGHWH